MSFQVLSQLRHKLDALQQFAAKGKKGREIGAPVLDPEQMKAVQDAIEELAEIAALGAAAGMFETAEAHHEANYEAIANMLRAKTAGAIGQRRGGCLVDLSEAGTADPKARRQEIRTRKGNAGYSLDELDAVVYQYVNFLNERTARAEGGAHSAHVAEVQGRKAEIDAMATASRVSLAFSLAMRQAGAEERRTKGLEGKIQAAKTAMHMKASFLKAQALKKEIAQLQAQRKGLDPEDRMGKFEIAQRISEIKFELFKMASAKREQFLIADKVDGEENRILHAINGSCMRLALAGEEDVGTVDGLRVKCKPRVGNDPATGPGILGTGVDFDAYARDQRKDAREARAGSSRAPAYQQYRAQKMRKDTLVQDIAARGESIQNDLLSGRG